MDMNNYGYWNGEQVIALTEQELLFNTSYNTIFLKPEDGNRVGKSMLSYKIESTLFSKKTYPEGNYSAYVIWRFGNDGKKEMECKGDKALDTSRWLCPNQKEILQKSVCDGYRDCNDTGSTDESSKVCSIDFPYDFFAGIITYLIVGLIGFLIFKLLSIFFVSCLEKTKKDIKKETFSSLLPQSEIKKMITFCSATDKDTLPKSKDSNLDKIAKDIHNSCDSTTKRMSLFQSMFSMSTYEPFRPMISNLAVRVINLKIEAENYKPIDHIQFLKIGKDESSYINGFVKDVIEKESCGANCMNNIGNCCKCDAENSNEKKSGKLDIFKVAMMVVWHFIKSIATIALFYQDMIKDIILCKILLYIDEKILNEDDDPLKEFQTVGGINFQVISLTLIAVLVISEVMIYIYMVQIRDQFEKAFRIESGNSWRKALIICFPVVFVALETFIVNSKITLIEYNINKLFKGESTDKITEDASIETFIALSNEHNNLIKQAYHLNHIEVEINLIELVMEQEPQVVLQGAFFILMQDYKRLEILSETAFAIDLYLYMVLTWTIQIICMARSCVRGIHRNRYPIGPGIAGTLLQGVSIILLLVPKLIIISVSLLNAIYWHPILIVANLAFSSFMLGGIVRNKVGIFDLIICLFAPAYHKLKEDEEIKNFKDKKLKDIKNWLSTISIHVFSIALYFSIGWILRKDVFIYKFNGLEHNFSNQNSFLKDVTSKTEMFPFWWQILIIAYIGCFVLYNAFVLLYYQMCHPWKIGREKMR